MKKAVLGVVAMALVAVAPAFAAEKASASASSSVAGHEVLFSAIQGTAGNAALNLEPTGLTIRLAVAYQRMVMDNIQLGLRGNMGINAAALPWLAQVWFDYNFDNNVMDSMFFGAGAGLTNLQTTGYLNVQWGVEIGKRFEVCHGLIYRPTVEFDHITSVGSKIINFNFLAFSYVW